MSLWNCPKHGLYGGRVDCPDCGRKGDYEGPPKNALSEEAMLGPFFKEYADLGHWFDAAHGKCIRCGTPTIDLYEDGVYGPLRRCSRTKDPQVNS